MAAFKYREACFGRSIRPACLRPRESEGDMARDGSRKIGCAGACLLFFLACIVIGLAALLVPIAAGIGAWFLIRFVWRSAVAEDPKNPLVQKGLAIAPIWRKLAAAVPCFLLACVLMAVIVPPSQKTPSASNEQQAAPSATVSQPAEGSASEQSADEPASQDLGVSFIDVGQGDATLLKLPDGRTMLVDSGPDTTAKAVENELAKQGVERLDYVIATHADSDHIAGMAEVIKSHEVGEFLAPQSTHTTDTYLNLLQTVKDKGVASSAAWASDVIAYGQDFSVKILSPAEGSTYKESNDWSVVLLVTYGDTKLLLTGDAPKEILKGLDVGKVDVLKVSHHGSDTGTDAELTAALSPKYAVISYGIDNEYGHPTQGVLDALSTSTVYGTGVNGTVRATTDGKTFDISTEKDGIVKSPAAEKDGSQGQEEEADAAQDTAAAQDAATSDDAAAGSGSDSGASAQEQGSEETVVVTPSGSKYHKRGCRTLSRSKTLTEMTKDQAIAAGYGPCGVCHP